MANTPIDMNKLRSTIRLHTQGKSKRFISAQLGLSRNTVVKYIDRFIASLLTYEDIQHKPDSELHRLFQLPLAKEQPSKLKALHQFFSRAEKQLKKPGMTLLLLWEAYLTEQPNGYGKTQFYTYYQRWKGTMNPSMRIDHKAGDKMYVDYAGKKLHVVDPVSGECLEQELFVAILGGSQLIYCEASSSQKKEDFVSSCEQALLYYGGVPSAIVPDNLKSAVTKSHRYEPVLNETFADFAEHYQTSIIPARPFKPKDKALVEGAVKIIYTAIYTKLQNQHFFRLEDLNEAIWELLEELNNRLLTGKPYSRRDLFEELEKQELKPLAQQPYQIKEAAWATVMKTGHVLLQKDKHHYSVPYQLIGRKVKVVYSPKKVWIYHNHECVAEHERTKSPYNYTTLESHLASTHKFITQWNPDYFLKWAASIHPDVELVIRNVLERKKHPEQAYRSCIGILSLAKKVGNDRLVMACERALEYGVCNYKMVQYILEKGLDKLPENETEEDLPSTRHNNIRGNQYYA